MITNPSRQPKKHLARWSVLFVVGSVGLAGCSPATTDSSKSVVEGAALPRIRTVGEILRSDPQFSDFVHVIDFAGLGNSLDEVHNITIFAPTNAAFVHAEHDWRVKAVPDMTELGAGVQKRQMLIEQSMLDGVHPVSDFTGKQQDVRARNGSIFHIDARKLGVFSITTGQTATGIGFAQLVLRTAHVEMPPIAATDGLIYPVDNILIR